PLANQRHFTWVAQSGDRRSFVVFVFGVRLWRTNDTSPGSPKAATGEASSFLFLAFASGEPTTLHLGRPKRRPAKLRRFCFWRSPLANQRHFTWVAQSGDRRSFVVFVFGVRLWRTNDTSPGSPKAATGEASSFLFLAFASGEPTTLHLGRPKRRPAKLRRFCFWRSPLANQRHFTWVA